MPCATARGAASPTRCAPATSHSRGDVLVFYPADLQFKPEDIPRLVAPILAGESDMVTGFKEGKYEKAFVSGIYNRPEPHALRRAGADLNSVKAYRREIMDSAAGAPRLASLHDRHRRGAGIHRHGNPGAALSAPRRASRSSGSGAHSGRRARHARRCGSSSASGSKPLLLFGMLGAFLFLVGVLAGIVAVLYRIFAGVGFRPLLTLIEVCLLLGSVFFATGLLAELMAAQRAEIAELRRRVEELLVRETDS